MKTLKEIIAKSKEYAPDDIIRQESFVEGARWAFTGKYYKEAECFVKKTSVIIGDRKENLEIPTFEAWWNAYSKKRGRKKTEAKWNKLSLQDKAACMKATPAYVASTPDVKYRLDPLTYLNGERWNDEIISSKQTGADVGIILHDSKTKDYKKGAW